MDIDLELPLTTDMVRPRWKIDVDTWLLDADHPVLARDFFSE